MIEIVEKYPKFIPHTINFISSVEKYKPERYILHTYFFIIIIRICSGHSYCNWAVGILTRMKSAESESMHIPLCMRRHFSVSSMDE